MEQVELERVRGGEEMKMRIEMFDKLAFPSTTNVSGLGVAVELFDYSK